MTPPRIAALLLGLSALVVSAAEPQVDATQLPRVPATEPAQAISTFRVKPGFRLELVASEPDVIDPIALSFDEDGRCYVIEMRDYSERRPERLGRIRRLEDTDGDGRFDKSVVFASGLPWPTAVICWKGGVFVGATPDLLYLKDTSGDGVADVQEVIFTGFAADHAPYETNKLNVQALFNCFNWSLDNRIHGATSFNGGKVKRNYSPYVQAWITRAGSQTRNSKPEAQNEILELRGRDFSFDPRTLEIRAESGGGQYGMSFDNRGRKYVCSNASHLQALLYEDRYAARNSISMLPRALADIAIDGGAAPVFRISPDEPWRVIRSQWRVAGLVKGPVEGGGKPSGYFTGATGVTIYRGDAFGPQFVGDAFVGDAGGNLVHRKKIFPDGTNLKAARPADEQNVEFLASTDNWFRPVQMANAPDGCLYICDMYREVIEHPWSLPDSLKKHLDLNSGNDRGRIYRIVPENFKQRPPPRLSTASTKDLVLLLEHPNGWHRDTATRLLYERQYSAAVPRLQRLVQATNSPWGRLHALYGLRGQRALTSGILEAKLGDPSPIIRQHTIRLAEEFLSQTNSSALTSKLAAMGKDTDPTVLLQLAFSASELPDDERRTAVETILRTQPGGLTRAAAVASLGDQSLPLFTKVMKENSVTARRIAPVLARNLGFRQQPREVRAVFDLLPAQVSPLELSVISELAEGLNAVGKSIQKSASREQLAPYFASAREWAVATDTRLAAVKDYAPDDAAIRLLGFAPYEEARPLLELLKSSRSPDVQGKVLAALNRQTDRALAVDLLAAWPGLTPAVRSQIIDLLVRRPERIHALLKSIGEKRVVKDDLSTAQQALLRSHRDPTIRDEAVRLLGPDSTGSKQSLVDSFLPALKLRGSDARGRQLFQARCATCHKLGAEGHALGPDLATVKSAGKEKILTSILDPNREVNANYQSFAVDTKDGESFVGLIANEDSNRVLLRMAGGLEMNLARSTISSMKNQGRSLMPEGLEEGMSAQDMADLLEFLIK